MSEFKEAIPAGGGKITYHFDANKGIAFEVSGFMRALYFVALSMDGRQILCVEDQNTRGNAKPRRRSRRPSGSRKHKEQDFALAVPSSQAKELGGADPGAISIALIFEGFCNSLMSNY